MHPNDTNNIKTRAKAEILRFVSERGNGSVCPSEVARLLAHEQSTEGWRELMPLVHVATDELKVQGKISLSWKTVHMSERSGPYRIGKPQ
jgi:hypothetical protein